VVLLLGAIVLWLLLNATLRNLWLIAAIVAGCCCCRADVEKLAGTMPPKEIRRKLEAKYGEIIKGTLMKQVRRHARIATERCDAEVHGINKLEQDTKADLDSFFDAHNFETCISQRRDEIRNGLDGDVGAGSWGDIEQLAPQEFQALYNEAFVLHGHAVGVKNHSLSIEDTMCVVASYNQLLLAAEQKKKLHFNNWNIDLQFKVVHQGHPYVMITFTDMQCKAHVIAVATVNSENERDVSKVVAVVVQHINFVARDRGRVGYEHKVDVCMSDGSAAIKNSCVKQFDVRTDGLVRHMWLQCWVSSFAGVVEC
jgi:hypothetical protein